MDFTLLSSIYTIVSMVVFLGILFWAYNGKNKKQFEELGRTVMAIDNETGITGN
jgi:cbb3-type cytochrome oxidase subunit 3